MKNAAARIHALVKSLGVEKARVVGHDIGLMVAYAYAAQFYYSILLFVPAHTTIQAHSHRDDRVATVVSGDWQFGYGARFNEELLKTLQPGSVYSEPKGINHFARTGNDAVVVQISGYGPTDTRYVDPKNDPDPRQRN